MSVRKHGKGWQAEVYTPNGDRIYETFTLKGQAKDWETEQRARFAKGDLRDPRSGQMKVAEWFGRWFAAHGVEEVTRRKYDSVWRVHCDPQWGAWPMSAITRMEAKEWVEVLKAKRGRRGEPLSADTVHQCVNLMSGLIKAGVESLIVAGNPFEALPNLPTIPPSPVLFYDDAEVTAILAAVVRDSDRVMMEVGFWSGLRPGELFGLFGDRVNWLRGKAEVTRVQTRVGLREYPKSEKSFRSVPIRPATMAGMREVIKGRALDGRVFLTREGCPIDDSNFRHRVWAPAVRRAGVRDLSPRAMRHTAASRLVMAGVDLYRVQALLGHESFRTTQRYAHLAPGAHDDILAAWEGAG